jgi:nucleoside-diphosphate-sugar epimerase
MSKNILIIGSKGYLGKHIIRYLNNSNSVYILDRNDINEFIYTGKIRFKIRFDVLVNCIVDYHNNSAQIIESNFFLPIKICQKIKKSTNFQVFHFDSFYSKFFESAPRNAYLLSKKSMLEWAEIFHFETPGITTFVLRLEHVIGKNESEKKFNGWLINSLRSNQNISLSNSNHKIDIIHIEDILVLIKLLIDKDFYKGEFKILEVGSGKNYSIKTFAQKIKAKLKSESKISYDKTLDDYKTRSSISNIKELIELGWKPKSDIDEIIDLIL